MDLYQPPNLQFNLSVRKDLPSIQNLLLLFVNGVSTLGSRDEIPNGLNLVETSAFNIT